MAITKMICQQCSAPIEWDGVSRRLQCDFCGTVYERTSRQGGQINNQRYIDEKGNEFLVGYYPPMFHGAYQIRDRVNNMRSEAIRGVNSYTTGSGDFVEADVRFDNVYQNTQNPDLYAGVEGAYSMGSEWTALKKRF